MFHRSRRDLPSLFGEATGRFGLGHAAVDLTESDEEFTVTMDLPGFDDEDIDVRMTDHTLHVEAEREGESESEEEEYLRRERSHRSISRTVRLPEDVHRDAAEATYTNGVLTISIPKKGVRGTPRPHLPR